MAGAAASSDASRAVRTAQRTPDRYLEAIPAADRVVCDAPQAAILRAALGNAAVQFRSQRIREIGNTATGAAKAAGSLGA